MKEKCKDMIEKKQDAMDKKFHQFQNQLNKRMSQFTTYQSKITRATEYQKYLKDTLYEKENEIKRLNANIKNNNERLRELENKAKKIEQDYSKAFKGVSKDMQKDKIRVYTDLEKQLIREREDAHETAKELINRLNASEKQLERSKSALSYLQNQKDNKNTNKYISKLEKEKQNYEKERTELFNEINKKSETIRKYRSIIEKTLTKLEQEDIINFMGAFQQACDIMRKDLPENSILNT
jgi:chromosome segregation ATPase